MIGIGNRHSKHAASSRKSPFDIYHNAVGKLRHSSYFDAIATGPLFSKKGGYDHVLVKIYNWLLRCWREAL